MTYDNTVPAEVVNFMTSFTNAIINPLLALIFAAALAYFLFGLMVFIFNAGEPAKRVEGKQHMLWGIIGMVVMVTVAGILEVLLNTFGVDENEVPAGIPLDL
jgi:succinate dehydrogenase/fumarate reductase cytochrome b subunit